MKNSPEHEIRPRSALKSALVAPLIYAGVAAVWIIGSDQVIAALFQSPETISTLQTYKGLIFVVTTSLLLLVLLRRQFNRYVER